MYGGDGYEIAFEIFDRAVSGLYCRSISNLFLIASGLRTAGRFQVAAGRGAARCAGPADPNTAAIDEGDTAAPFTEGRGVHAGDGHAPRAGGRDDGAHRVAYGEQGATAARSAHQQIAIGRNEVHERVARSEGRAGFAADAGNARHGYARPRHVEPSHAHARDAYPEADGRLEKSE